MTDRTAKAIELIKGNWPYGVPVSDVAREAKVSKQYISQLCAKLGVRTRALGYNKLLRSPCIYCGEPNSRSNFHYHKACAKANGGKKVDMTCAVCSRIRRLYKYYNRARSPNPWVCSVPCRRMALKLGMYTRKSA